MNSNPGICSDKSVMNIDNKLFRDVCEFITLHGRIADIGCINAKSRYISDYFDTNIEQINRDFNIYDISQGYINAFDVVLCLEVLEHLQNPLFFMRNLKAMIKKNGTIYLSLPARPRFLWTEHHFFEIDKKHLIRWILNPLGLEIVRSKKIRINHSFWFYLSGIRPFFRIFFNYTFIYEINRRKA